MINEVYLFILMISSAMFLFLAEFLVVFGKQSKAAGRRGFEAVREVDTFFSRGGESRTSGSVPGGARVLKPAGIPHHQHFPGAGSGGQWRSKRPVCILALASGWGNSGPVLGSGSCLGVLHVSKCV